MKEGNKETKNRNQRSKTMRRQKRKGETKKHLDRGKKIENCKNKEH
jgi:hypothetical protein